MKMMLTLFIFSLLSFSFSHASVVDFCVADLTVPNSPAGYSCKNQSKVTADDFTYSLDTPGITFNIFKVALNPAVVSQLPGLNGLGISISRLDIATGGVVPLHTHPGASEIIVMIQGTLRAGFVSYDNKVYNKTLKTGDVFVFPQGLLHFQVNVGGTQVLAYASFGSENPGLQILDYALFKSDFPTELITATTLLDPVQVKKLKVVFGGSG